MANTSLTRTMGTPTSRKKFTISVWVKRTKITLSNAQHIWNGYYSADNRLVIYFQNGANDALGFYNVAGGSATANLQTNRQFRDTHAWYHIYYAVDTTQSTSSDRVKLYINGQQETSFSTASYPSQDVNLTFASGYTNLIGNYGGSNNFFEGLMSHFYYVDGSVIAHTEFGSTDTTTGEWKINTDPTISSYGTNGFLILKDGNTITDQSPNSNDFTSNGVGVTKTEDNPSNVFATFNPLTKWSGQNKTPSQVLNKGNLTTGIGSSEKALLLSTIGVTSGKYYWEAKSDGVSKLFFGFSNRLVFDTSSDPHSQSGYNGVYYYEGTPDFRTYGSNTSTTGIASITTGDILGFALDMDNHAFYIHKNGTYMNSGDPTSGSSRTGSIAELFTYGRNCLSDYDEVFASAYVTSTSGSGTASFNFGNGYFGTTAVSSAGTNASGIGIFEHNVPAGYTALSTKGLNE